MTDEYVICSDGGSRGNPGPAGAGFTITHRGKVVVAAGCYLGVTTNNVAEYEALHWGLQNARELGAQQVSVCADSELVVKQLKGEYKVKAKGLQPLFFKTMRLLKEFDSYRIEHIYREENTAADELANQAMDVRHVVGNAVVAPPHHADMPQGESGTLFDVTFDETPAPAAEPVNAPAAAPTPKPAPKPQPTADREDISGMYYLTVKDHFDAAHNLYGYDGECRLLHGHTWDVEVTVSSPELDDIGIVYDFKSLKADLAKVLQAYDHVHINTVVPFDEISPTAENLARIICKQLQATVDPRVSVIEVAVWESPIARVGYRPSL